MEDPDWQRSWAWGRGCLSLSGDVGLGCECVAKFRPLTFLFRHALLIRNVVPSWWPNMNSTQLPGPMVENFSNMLGRETRPPPYRIFRYFNENLS